MPLVPRRTFFRNPDRANVRLSADGTHLAWAEPVAGIQNVFVASVDDLTRARQVTHETLRSISDYVWAYINRHLAVLSVNFRGSTGFGKAFIGVADQEWGGRMQDDLTDAAAWVAAQGYADPLRAVLNWRCGWTTIRRRARRHAGST
jgi:hypothetical protein